jgi:hypothetical protein
MGVIRENFIMVPVQRSNRTRLPVEILLAAFVFPSQPVNTLEPRKLPLTVTRI